MELHGMTIVAIAILSAITGLDAKRKGRRCKAAVYRIPKPENGRVFACCRYKRIKFECNQGYKLVEGDTFVRCKKGKILGKLPKCILASNTNGDCGEAGYNRNRGRIVGGKRSAEGDWPWMAAIHRDGKFLCGGSLITATHVLTAAHCFQTIFRTLSKPERYGVWLGKTELHSRAHAKKQFRNVKRIHIHGKFQRHNFTNDIAIIELSSPPIFNSFIGTVCLPGTGALRPRQKMYTMGWGGTKQHSGLRRPDKYSDVLRHVMLPIATDEVCQKSLPSSASFDKSTMLCAGDGGGKRDACFGDSGGPLVYQAKETAKGKAHYRWRIVGIVSWGDGCAKKGKYGYFTRVSFYKDWIKNAIGSQI